jgi:hypothetical protein
MAIEFKKKAIPGKTPVIWRGECKILPGGFKPKQSFPVGTVLRRGIPIQVDFEDMSAGVVKIAKVLDGGTTTNARVGKGHLFVVGDKVQKLGTTTSSTVSKIDTSNADYDVITFASAITGLVAGDNIQESDGEDTAKPLYVPNMVIGHDLEFKGTGIPTIDAAYEAMVLYNHVSYPIPTDWLLDAQKSPCLKSNPNIMFIKQ